jgi:NAD(P)-dependent dehydrogenase (short-subunit alcohol dehydrogenase family)
MRGTVMVTGGGRGIGAAVVRTLAREGWHVAVNYARDGERAEAVAAQAREMGVQALACQASVADEQQVEQLFHRVDDELPPLAALVNNAGILFTQARLEDMDAERMRAVLEVNVVGAMLCAREAIRRMSPRHGGSGGGIVNVSSRAAVLGAANEYVDYAASKGALDSLTVGLAQELAAEGIRVNAVRPGIIRTEIHASGGEPGRAERLGPGVPMGRAGEAQEVADAIAWLLGEHASFVTGTFIEVSGGR